MTPTTTSPTVLKWGEAAPPRTTVRTAAPARREKRASSGAKLLHVVAAVVLMLVPRDVVESIPTEFLVWMTFAFLAALTAAGYRRAKRTGDNPWIAPDYLLLAFYTYLMGFGALVAYYWGFIPWEVYPYMKTFFFEGRAWYHLPMACYLIVIGGLGLNLGLLLKRKRVAAYLPSLQWRMSEANFQVGIMVYAPVMLLLFALVRSHLPLSLMFFSVLFASATDGMLVAGAYYLFSATEGSKRIQWAMFLVIAYCAGLPTSLSSGQIVPLLMPFMMMLCGYVMARRTLPWLTIGTGALIAILFVLPFMAFYKFAGAKGTPIDVRIHRAWQQYSAVGTGGKIEVALSRSLARFAVPKLTAVYSEYYPDVYPFEHGNSFILELSGLIPRLVWPDKPNKSTDLNRYSERVGLVRANSETSAVFDAISEYYINFGAIGVFLFCILHGWYHALLYEWLVKCGHFLIGTALYLGIMFSNWDFFGVVNLFESQIKTIPVWLLIYYVLSRSGKTKSTAMRYQ